MYAAFWRALPGPVWLRLLLCLILLAAVLASLVLWLFPFVDSFLTPQEVTVGQ